MAGKEDYRIFVGGLSWNVTERQLENAFARFGKVVEAQIMMERDTGRPRGFGFITFSDRRGMEDSIREMHGREFGDRTISVNKAQPKVGDDDGADHGYKGGFSSARKSYGGGERTAGQDDCFKCGRPGHWARDCPSSGGGGGRGGGRFGDRFGGRGDRFGGDRFGGDRDRYVDDRYDPGRYGERGRYESRDSKYVERDRYASDRYQPTDRFGSERYGAVDRYPQNGYERDTAPRGGAVDRYSGGGSTREGRSYRSTRPAPYDRPAPRVRQSSFDRY